MLSGLSIILLLGLFAASNTEPAIPAVSQPVTFRLEACGGGSGGYSCMTKPDNCNSLESCEIIAAWAPTPDGVEFTLIGKAIGPSYVSIGFGENTNEDQTRSTVCGWDGDQLSIFNTFTDEGETNVLEAPLATAGISHAHGQFSNSRLSCRFVRSIVASESEKVAKLDSAVHVFLTSGELEGPRKLKKNAERPMVSGLQHLNQPSVSGRVAAADEHHKSRPLWRAHGILMIIAWILIALSASLQPRYYQQMWPNNRPCGNHVWFAIHQPLVIIATVLFTIGFIIALVAAGGKYRLSSELPQRAHPILGLIALILGWINPLISFFRCKPDAYYRPIFNWIYFTIGTIAIVFATVNCFIGLTFSVVRAPAWTAWVLVAAVVFHLIVEILLELAGCFYYTRNKEKLEQFELRQQALSTDHDPEPFITKPKPAGALFKEVLLGLHSVVMTSLVLAIIIGILCN